MQSSLVYWISTDVCKLDEAPWKTTEEVVYARLTTVSGLEFKFYSYNPWDHNEKCTPLKPSGPGATAPADHGLTTIQTRKQSSITETLANDGGERHRNVVALDGLTFTSPSIYINFRGLQAYDGCGTYGSSIGETVIAFHPDEISTIVGGGNIGSNLDIKPMNFADLPCPPQDVMESNWYKPAPGEPYIPRLAFPTKLSSLNPLWTTCVGDYFIGYDPPRTLVPVSVLDPPTTSAPSSTAEITQGGDPAIVGGPTPAPVSTPELHQPQQTATTSIKPTLVDGGHSFPTDIPAQGDLPMEGSNDGGAGGVSSLPHSKASDTDPGSNPGNERPGLPSNPSNNPGLPSASHAISQDPNGQPAIITNIAGHAAGILPHSIEIGTITLTQGEPSITVSEMVLSLGSSSIVIASKTIPLPKSQQAITTIAGRPLIYHPHVVVIAEDRLTPGAFPKTLPNGAVVSIDPYGVVAALKPMALPQSNSIVTKFLGHDMTLHPHAVVFSGTTLTSGGSPFTLSGMSIAVGSSSLSIGSQIIPFDQLYHVSTIAAQKSVPVSGHTASGVTLSGSRISLDSVGNLVIDGTTLKPGNPGMTLDRHSISVAPGQALVFDGSTLIPGGSAMSLEDMPVSMNDNGDLVVAGSTLLPGSDVVQFGKFPVSMASNGDLFIGRSTLRAGDHAATIKGVTISVAPNGDPVLDGTTLLPGVSAVTVDGKPFSMASNGNLVIDGTTIIPGNSDTLPGHITTSQAFNGALVIAGTTLIPGGQGATLKSMSVSVAPDGDLVLSGSTLTLGGSAVTIEGKPVFVASDGNLVINGSTLRLGATTGAANSAIDVSTLSSDGLGALIVGAFGDVSTVASVTGNSSTALAFQGKATSAAAPFVLITIVVLASVVLDCIY
ncbi:MAG: hypothetical protein HETSPECPRED_002418 [Heterodermia speciosa]|uniref:Uncharacterized protein n=1 Tax=Heterodermia speciosa TaxID=116794 RepID=A0A8H3J4B6_9LECA|nr:MAG: hypothetical protein HETSPECPRED_002418 [Heterodermia speciosa]